MLYGWNIKRKNDKDYLITSHIALSTNLYFSFVWYIIHSMYVHYILYIYYICTYMRRRGDEMVGWHHSSVDMNLSKSLHYLGRQWRQGSLCAAVHEVIESQHDLGTEQQNVLHMSLIQCFMSQILVKYKRFFGVFLYKLCILRHFLSVIISTNTPKLW